MTVYSFSRLETYKSCPLKFKFNYIDKIKTDEKSIEAFMGNRFHEAMEKLYGELRFRVMELDELLAYYDENWEKKDDGNIVIVKKNRTLQEYKDLGRKCAEEYYRHYHPFDQGKVLGNEVLVKIELDEEGKYAMQGYIDRLVERDAGKYEIHDYKTAGYLPDQKKMDADKQLALYQIGVAQKWNDVKDVDLVWHYVVFDKEIRSSRTEEQLEDLKTEYMAFIDRVEAETEYEPHESRLCDWCSYQGICPKKKHGVQVSELPINEYKKDPGVKLVKEYARLEVDKKELGGKMKEIEIKQDKIKEAAIEFAVKEEVSVIGGPDAVLKVDIREEMRGPTKTKEPEETEQLRQAIIDEGRLEEVATVNNSELIKRIKNGDWTGTILDKVIPFLKKEEKKMVRLVKKKDTEK